MKKTYTLCGLLIIAEVSPIVVPFVLTYLRNSLTEPSGV